jgi:hypothetical protein
MGGAAATLGTIGGSGPATSTRGWMRVLTLQAAGCRCGNEKEKPT